MIAKIVELLRPFCVACTLLLAILTILSFWGWDLLPSDIYWKIFFSYLALLVTYAVVSFIDDPHRFRGRK